MDRVKYFEKIYVLLMEALDKLDYEEFYLLLDRVSMLIEDLEK